MCGKMSDPARQRQTGALEAPGNATWQPRRLGTTRTVVRGPELDCSFRLEPSGCTSRFSRDAISASGGLSLLGSRDAFNVNRKDVDLEIGVFVLTTGSNRVPGLKLYFGQLVGRSAGRSVVD